MEKANPGRKKMVVMAVVAILIIVLAGGAGLAVRWWQNRDTGGDANVEQGSGFSPIIDEIQDLNSAGNLSEADAKINEALKDSNLPQKERYQLYIQQGNTANDKKDYAAAIASYQQAEAIEKTYEVTLLLADTWAEAGDKAKALDYYKKALLIVPDTPARDDTKELIEQLIKNLEAGA